jgi:hypothetical protein
LPPFSGSNRLAGGSGIEESLRSLRKRGGPHPELRSACAQAAYTAVCLRFLVRNVG